MIICNLISRNCKAGSCKYSNFRFFEIETAHYHYKSSKNFYLDKALKLSICDLPTASKPILF